jgi:hypothetical protein
MTSGLVWSYHAGSAGGNIHLDVGRLTLTVGGTIRSSTVGTAQGGTITVRARDEIAIVDPGVPDVFSRIEAVSRTGRTGDIIVSASSVVLDGGAITTQVGRAGGAIAVQDVGRVRVTGGGFIQSLALSGGQAAGVTITDTDAVSITNGGFINSLAAPGGKPGPTVVKASALLIDSGTLGAFALADSEMAAGDVTVEVATLSLTGGGRIVSGTAGAGAGGTITIAARESISITGRGSQNDFPSNISSSTIGSGKAAACSCPPRH